MTRVSIIGIGQTSVGEHWDVSIRDLGAQAVLAALHDAGIERPDALYVGNMLSGPLASQEQLATLIADWSGLRGIEALKAEAACASGAAALRVGYMAVASGLHDVVVVLGVEKMTDLDGDEATIALMNAADAEYEAIHGTTFISLNAMLMRRYMEEYQVPHEAFAGFPVNSHANAVYNPQAMFHQAITRETFVGARMIADPINLFDSAPIADGAAAVVLCAAERARELVPHPVRIAASSVATDSVALHDRHDPLFLAAVYNSAMKAYRQAEIGPQDIDLFELHDAFSIIAALSLEASGFAPRGQGTRLAADGEIGPHGRVPIATMGGLKARGHPVGATGLYQVVEAALQLRGEAGKNQVPDAHWAMTQNVGGVGGTAFTHILEG
ncbi:MAG TPA: thiolase domain-containing protein [Anaerolineae bacterium]|nr:thiolase domain-containing protein [Anaerolineae bacterium]HOR00685.1 thiolase domain-containing protein [Anaerolineae bacterium]HPL29979.1 thiolase domain-containing protein [Anaerolineae bacterium]